MQEPYGELWHAVAAGSTSRGGFVGQGWSWTKNCLVFPGGKSDSYTFMMFYDKFCCTFYTLSCGLLPDTFEKAFRRSKLMSRVFKFAFLFFGAAYVPWSRIACYDNMEKPYFSVNHSYYIGPVLRILNRYVGGICLYTSPFKVVDSESTLPLPPFVVGNALQAQGLLRGLCQESQVAAVTEGAPEAPEAPPAPLPILPAVETVEEDVPWMMN